MQMDNQLKLYPYNESLSHTVTINKNQIENHMWIELPHNKSKYLTLTGVVECKSGESNISIDYEQYIERDADRPWLKIKLDLFNTNVGYHLYKFIFAESRINSDISLFLSYRIQDDNPDKPYIYMKREENLNG